jgi:hypothetical protein
MAKTRFITRHDATPVDVEAFLLREQRGTDSIGRELDYSLMCVVVDSDETITADEFPMPAECWREVDATVVDPSDRVINAMYWPSGDSLTWIVRDKSGRSWDYSRTLSTIVPIAA